MFPIPAMHSLLGQDFSTPLGRILTRSLTLEQGQILSTGTLRSLSREGCFPDAYCVGVVRAVM